LPPRAELAGGGFSGSTSGKLLAEMIGYGLAFKQTLLCQKQQGTAAIVSAVPVFLLDGHCRRKSCNSVDLLGKLKRRLGLDDGALLGKSVKSVYPQGAVPRLNVDVADSPEAHPPAPVELMEQPVSQGVHAQAPMIVP